MAAEYILREGNSQVMLCERGIRTFERSTRFTLDIGAVPVLKEETHLPVIVDPSHAAGRRDLVAPLARAAVAAGADGIIVEVHPEPDQALSDAAQQIAADEFGGLRGRDPGPGLAHGPSHRLSRMRVRESSATGLIGASVGLAAGANGHQRAGLGRDPDALRVAAERGAVRARRDRWRRPCARPTSRSSPRRSPRSPAQVEAALGAGGTATVTDVGSTKGAVCAAASDRQRFVGGHPVAGSEAHGPANANGELFRGATWFLTPVAETEPERYRALHGFVASLGAIPVAVDPRAHDRLVALTSHLPHALANLLLNHAGLAAGRRARAARRGGRARSGT